MSTQAPGTQAPDTPGEEVNVPDPGGDQEKGGREAQRLRARAREAEAQRDALTVKVAAQQRRDVLREAGQHLAMPDDLLTLGGVDVTDLLDDQGEVDPAAVAEAAAALVAERGDRFAAPKRNVSFDGGARPAPARRQASWQSVLSDRCDRR